MIKFVGSKGKEDSFQCFQRSVKACFSELLFRIQLICENLPVSKYLYIFDPFLSRNLTCFEEAEKLRLIIGLQPKAPVERVTGNTIWGIEDPSGTRGTGVSFGCPIEKDCVSFLSSPPVMKCFIGVSLFPYWMLCLRREEVLSTLRFKRSKPPLLNWLKRCVLFVILQLGHF